MRRFLALILCCLLFATTVYADNAATSVQTGATVSSDGTCQVSIGMTIRLDQPVSELSLPLGSNISSVRLNGSSARLQTRDGITSVLLNELVRNVTGNVSLQVSFTVNSAVITDEDGKQTVVVPLLFGFTYPVESMNFSVTMPGSFDTVPTFRSGYHQQDIESNLTSTVLGSTVSGSITAPLKDHETLIMALEAPEGMFPQAQSTGGSLTFDAVAMGICGALAFVYWLMTMACLPRFPVRRSTAPDGLSAGTLGCYLTRSGASLNLMVITWAQLGYLIIHTNDNGRVMLHKKMEMGNERSAFEGRIFKSLFSKGSVTDATSFRYARLCEEAAQRSLRSAWGFRKESGDPRVLRILGCGVGLFAGIAMGDNLASAPAWRVILMILLGFAGAVGSWHIQGASYSVHLPNKRRLLNALVAALAMVLAGLLSDCVNYGLWTAGGNLAIGALAALTGRRTENGNQIRDEILGLRRHMCRVTKQELARIMRSNPDYYYELAPYALALGVDKRFARQFGSLRQTHCTWLVTGLGAPSTAMEWYPRLRDAFNAMNAPDKRGPLEKLLNKR